MTKYFGENAVTATIALTASNFTVARCLRKQNRDLLVGLGANGRRIQRLERNVLGQGHDALDLGARLGLPGMTNEDGTAKFKDYGDYIANHERKPGIGPLAGFRGKGGDEAGRGAPNENQVDAYIKNGGFWHHDLPEEARFFKHANVAYQDFAVEMGFYDSPQPYDFQIYSEVLQKFKKSSELEEDFLYRPTTPSKIYIKRCEEFLKNPPPKNWSGVWEMKTK